MESLQGSFLIATPRMPDPRFRQQVVYVCVHNDAEGAMGLIINQPTDFSLAEVMKGAEIALPTQALPPIYLGGPVEMEAGFFLYSADYVCPHFVEIAEQIHLSRDVEILRDIARGRAPADYLFALGYSGWGPGQLEAELAEDCWLVLPGDYQVIPHPRSVQMEAGGQSGRDRHCHFRRCSRLGLTVRKKFCLSRHVQVYKQPQRERAVETTFSGAYNCPRGFSDVANVAIAAMARPRFPLIRMIGSG